VKVTAVSGSNSFTVNQTSTFDAHFFAQASGSFAYNNGCTKVDATIMTTSAGVTSISFNASSGGTYFIGIKYDAGSIVGQTINGFGPTFTYTFQLGSDASSNKTLLVVPKKP
jgi:hypothetical protein